MPKERGKKSNTNLTYICEQDALCTHTQKNKKGFTALKRHSVLVAKKEFRYEDKKNAISCLSLILCLYFYMTSFSLPRPLCCSCAIFTNHFTVIVRSITLQIIFFIFKRRLYSILKGAALLIKLLNISITSYRKNKSLMDIIFL